MNDLQRILENQRVEHPVKDLGEEKYIVYIWLEF